MAKRLVKIAKELNVGTTRIVEFLKKNGYEVENRPTAKLTVEMENALVREFQSSKQIKEQADQLIRQAPPKKEREAFKLDLSPPPPPPPPIGVPELVVPTPPPLPKDPVTPPPPTKKDLVAPPPSPKKEKEKETPPPPPPKKEELQTPPPPTKETPPVPGLKVLGKVDLNEINRKKTRSSKKRDRDNRRKPKEGKAKVEPVSKKEKVTPVTPPVEKKAKVLPKKEEKKIPPKKEETPPPVEKKEGDAEFRAKTPKLEGLKIKGKINLDGFNRSSRRDSKKKDDKDPKKKKEETTSKEGGDPQKRRRKRKKVVSKKPIEGNKRSDAGTSRRRRGGTGDKKKKEETKEVSAKQIEERIKATQARLGGGGKRVRQKMRRESRAKKREERERIEQENTETRLQLTEFISVSELASLMDVSPTQVITTCMSLGLFVTLNQRLDAGVIELVAEEYGHEVIFVDAEEALEEEEEIEDNPEDLVPRAPIVTVMGHVDHGKTSLLDYVRKANVAEGEAGGITQHIGAYEVFVGEERKKVTFLDTPGHEAFTAMRARGAKVTDVAIIIISADDRIMPQTKEAISHAQAAGVPMVFAINKIDKDGADPERIKSELAQMNILVDDWSGTYQSQEISAKYGTGVEDLLELVLLEAEVLELKANPKRPAQGVVLEASLDKGRGYVSKTLVQTGTLKIGDPIVAGEHSGKVKAMFNEKGKRIKKAGPATPVLVLGLSGAPQAGEKFKVAESEQDARALANRRAIIAREQANRAQKRVSLIDITRRMALGSFKELNLIIKGDVDGSVEALADSLLKQSHETVQVNVIHKAVGQIIESDVMLASASDAIIIGFQVRPSGNARKLAEREGVEIRTYSIIYKAIEEIRDAIEGMLEPTKEEKVVCEVEIRETYKINRIGTVAGCFVRSGKIQRNTKIRIIRDGIVIYPMKEGQIGELGSLRRFKDDVKEVKTNFECGLTIKNFNDIKEGDIVEGYDIVEVKQTLD